MAEHLAKLITRNLPDKRALQAKRGKASERVGRRPARQFARRGHGFVKFVSPRFVDQRHPAAIELEFVDQLLLARSNHIDHGIADGDHIITGRGGFGHGKFLQ